MKKQFALVFAVLTLVGCTSSRQESKTTVCTIDEPYVLYSSAKQTFISEGDVAKKINFEGIMVASSKESLDATLEQYDVNLKTINSLEGVTARYERIDDVTLKDIAEYDLAKTSMETLEQIGLMQTTNSNAKLISVEQSAKLLSESGFTCVVE